MPIVRVNQTEGDPAELEARYQRVQQRLRGGEAGSFPPAGLKVHTAMRTPSGFRVANVWESAEQADAAWQRISAILREEGGDLDAMRIEEYEVVNLVIP
jgi:hypothetical protein